MDILWSELDLVIHMYIYRYTGGVKKKCEISGARCEIVTFFRATLLYDVFFHIFENFKF